MPDTAAYGWLRRHFPQYMAHIMQDQEQAVTQFRELLAVALEDREPTALDWMMLGCAARDLGIPFDWASRLVAEHRGSRLSGSERQPGMPAHVAPLPPRTAYQPAPSGAPAPAIDAMQVVGSRAEPTRARSELQPQFSQAPAPETQASQAETLPSVPLQFAPEDLEHTPPPTLSQNHAPSPVLPPPPASERMIAIEGGVLMPESYVLVARNVRAKYAAFLESRLPVISMAAARNANLDIEMFQPGLDAGTSPPTDSLALWWGRTATTATAEELALIGRGSLVLNSAAWKAPVFLSILGWGCIDEPGLLSNGQLRKTLRRSWFQLRAERVGHWSESGWVTAQQFVGYKNDLGYFERLLALTSKEHVPPTLHFVKSLVSGLHAESASFAQQRKGLRALTGRIRGVESAAAMLPADGSLQEIQRAAGVALDSLEVALHIAQTASC